MVHNRLSTGDSIIPLKYLRPLGNSFPIQLQHIFWHKRKLDVLDHLNLYIYQVCSQWILDPHPPNSEEENEGDLPRKGQPRGYIFLYQMKNLISSYAFLLAP